jgi:hypothetical protein
MRKLQLSRPVILSICENIESLSLQNQFAAPCPSAPSPARHDETKSGIAAPHGQQGVNCAAFVDTTAVSFVFP